MKENLTLGSLFDGSGAFCLGALLSGIQPINSCEIEPYPIRVTTKRLPRVKHYGDIKKLNGAEIEPVDIITFGSPCQDMSQAGKRVGLENGKRSSLFYEAIRIIKEMRKSTNGKQPRYIVWENVTGAFTSNGGDDFKSVLQSICQIKDEAVSIPKPKRWTFSGSIVGRDYSVSWRVLDAQYFGVPQRRKRIYLVADFGGDNAGKILFEREGVPWHTPQSFSKRERTARDIKESLRAPSLGVDGYNGSISAAASTLGVNCGMSTGRNGVMVLNDQGGSRMDVTEEITGTLRAQSNHPPIVYEKEKCFDVRFTSEGTKNARANSYETSISRVIDTSGNTPNSNQGGVAVVSIEGNGARPSHQGNGYNESGKSYTLNTIERHGVAYGMDRASFNQGTNAKYAPSIEPELQPPLTARGPGAVAYHSSKNSHHTNFSDDDKAETLVASDYKDPPTITTEPNYIVRRLTPNECARLQGMPDWWCDDLETENPTKADIEFWKGVWNEWNEANGVKPKSEKQIITWLKNPKSDSAEYKMWGNGVALPCVFFVLSNICDLS